MAVQARTYDLVLMDVQMPGMDGITATKHIRELNHPAKHLPIVDMTANVLPNQVAQTRQAGMDDYIGKPFKRPDLYAVVERWANKSRCDVQALGEAVTPASAEAVFDREAFAGILEMMGRERTMGLLDKLTRELEVRFGEEEISAGADPIQTAQDAHALASAAGMLGFTALSNLCRILESACESRVDLAPLLPRIAPIRRAVLEEVERLQAA
jgi:DNA-binding response OmpR family regulator